MDCIAKNAERDDVRRLFRIEVEASYMTGAIVNVSGGRELFVRS